MGQAEHAEVRGERGKVESGSAEIAEDRRGRREEESRTCALRRRGARASEIQLGWASSVPAQM